MLLSVERIGCPRWWLAKYLLYIFVLKFCFSETIYRSSVKSVMLETTNSVIYFSVAEMMSSDSKNTRTSEAQTTCKWIKLLKSKLKWVPDKILVFWLGVYWLIFTLNNFPFIKKKKNTNGKLMIFNPNTQILLFLDYLTNLHRMILMMEASFLAHLAKGNVHFCHHLASETSQPNELKHGRKHL